MADIQRITISGKSGYLMMPRSYKDKVAVTKEGIQYQLVYDSFQGIDQDQVWSYKTNNLTFQKVFDNALKLLPSVLEYDESEYFILDGEPITLTVTYSDKSKVTRKILFPDGVIIDFFRAIRQMIPQTEQIPKVLWLPNDENDEATEGKP